MLNLLEIQKNKNLLKLEEETYKKIEEFLQNKEKKEILEDILKNWRGKKEEIKCFLAQNYCFLEDFFEEREKCKKCQGLEKCQKKYPGYIFSISLCNGIVPFFKIFLKNCEKRDQQEQEQENYTFFSLEKEYFCDFNENWKKDFLNENFEKTKKEIIKKINELYRFKDRKSFFIKGEPSSGKTYLAAFLAENFIKKRKQKVAFLNFKKRINEMRNLLINEKNKYENYIDVFLKAPLLVIDGLGEEYITNYSRDCILTTILELRSQDPELLTIVTSRYDFLELSKIYSKGNNFFLKDFQGLLKRVFREMIILKEEKNE